MCNIEYSTNTVPSFRRNIPCRISFRLSSVIVFIQRMLNVNHPPAFYEGGGVMRPRSCAALEELRERGICMGMMCSS